MAEITGILLAAGFSRRFGSNKLLHVIDGQPMIAHASLALKPCDRIVAIVQKNQALRSVLNGLRVECLENPQPERGIGYSIACAVSATPNSSGWCLLPADMPFVKATTTRQLVDTLRSGATLAAPVFQQQRGHPVGFGERFFSALTKLDGDIGARSLIAQHQDQLVMLATEDKGAIMDVDSIRDLACQS